MNWLTGLQGALVLLITIFLDPLSGAPHNGRTTEFVHIHGHPQHGHLSILNRHSSAKENAEKRIFHRISTRLLGHGRSPHRHFHNITRIHEFIHQRSNPDRAPIFGNSLRNMRRSLPRTPFWRFAYEDPLVTSGTESKTHTSLPDENVLDSTAASSEAVLSIVPYPDAGSSNGRTIAPPLLHVPESKSTTVEPLRIDPTISADVAKSKASEASLTVVPPSKEEVSEAIQTLRSAKKEPIVGASQAAELAKIMTQIIKQLVRLNDTETAKALEKVDIFKGTTVVSFDNATEGKTVEPVIKSDEGINVAALATLQAKTTLLDVNADLDKAEKELANQNIPSEADASDNVTWRSPSIEKSENGPAKSLPKSITEGSQDLAESEEMRSVSEKSEEKVKDISETTVATAGVLSSDEYIKEPTTEIISAHNEGRELATENVLDIESTATLNPQSIDAVKLLKHDLVTTDKLQEIVSSKVSEHNAEDQRTKETGENNVTTPSASIDVGRSSNDNPIEHETIEPAATIKNEVKENVVANVSQVSDDVQRAVENLEGKSVPSLLETGDTAKSADTLTAENVEEVGRSAPTIVESENIKQVNSSVEKSAETQQDESTDVVENEKETGRSAPILAETKNNEEGDSTAVKLDDSVTIIAQNESETGRSALNVVESANNDQVYSTVEKLAVTSLDTLIDSTENVEEAGRATSAIVETDNNKRDNSSTLQKLGVASHDVSTDVVENEEGRSAPSLVETENTAQDGNGTLQKLVETLDEVVVQNVEAGRSASNTVETENNTQDNNSTLLKLVETLDNAVQNFEAGRSAPSIVEAENYGQDNSTLQKLVENSENVPSDVVQNIDTGRSALSADESQNNAQDNKKNLQKLVEGSESVPTDVFQNVEAGKSAQTTVETENSTQNNNGLSEKLVEDSIAVASNVDQNIEAGRSASSLVETENNAQDNNISLQKIPETIDDVVAQSVEAGTSSILETEKHEHDDNSANKNLTYVSSDTVQNVEEGRSTTSIQETENNAQDNNMSLQKIPETIYDVEAARSSIPVTENNEHDDNSTIKNLTDVPSDTVQNVEIGRSTTSIQETENNAQDNNSTLQKLAETLQVVLSLEAGKLSPTLVEAQNNTQDTSNNSSLKKLDETLDVEIGRSDIIVTENNSQGNNNTVEKSTEVLDLLSDAAHNVESGRSAPSSVETESIEKNVKELAGTLQDIVSDVQRLVGGVSPKQTQDEQSETKTAAVDIVYPTKEKIDGSVSKDQVQGDSKEKDSARSHQIMDKVASVIGEIIYDVENLSSEKKEKTEGRSATSEGISNDTRKSIIPTPIEKATDKTIEEITSSAAKIADTVSLGSSDEVGNKKSDEIVKGQSAEEIISENHKIDNAVKEESKNIKSNETHTTDDQVEEGRSKSNDHSNGLVTLAKSLAEISTEPSVDPIFSSILDPAEFDEHKVASLKVDLSPDVENEKPKNTESGGDKQSARTFSDALNIGKEVSKETQKEKPEQTTNADVVTQNNDEGLTSSTAFPSDNKKFLTEVQEQTTEGRAYDEVESTTAEDKPTTNSKRSLKADDSREEIGSDDHEKVTDVYPENNKASDVGARITLEADDKEQKVVADLPNGSVSDESKTTEEGRSAEAETLPNFPEYSDDQAPSASEVTAKTLSPNSTNQITELEADQAIIVSDIFDIIQQAAELITRENAKIEASKLEANTTGPQNRSSEETKTDTELKKSILILANAPQNDTKRILTEILSTGTNGELRNGKSMKPITKEKTRQERKIDSTPFIINAPVDDVPQLSNDVRRSDVSVENEKEDELTPQHLVDIIPVIIRDLRTDVATAEDQRVLSEVYGDLWPNILQMAENPEHDLVRDKINTMAILEKLDPELSKLRSRQTSYELPDNKQAKPVTNGVARKKRQLFEDYFDPPQYNTYDEDDDEYDLEDAFVDNDSIGELLNVARAHDETKWRRI